MEPNVLQEWARSRVIEFENLSKLRSNPRTTATVLTDMDDIQREDLSMQN